MLLVNSRNAWYPKFDFHEFHTRSIKGNLESEFESSEFEFSGLGRPLGAIGSRTVPSPLHYPYPLSFLSISFSLLPLLSVLLLYSPLTTPLLCFWLFSQYIMKSAKDREKAHNDAVLDIELLPNVPSEDTSSSSSSDSPHSYGKPLGNMNPNTDNQANTTTSSLGVSAISLKDSNTALLVEDVTASPLQEKHFSDSSPNLLPFHHLNHVSVIGKCMYFLSVCISMENMLFSVSAYILQ